MTNEIKEILGKWRCYIGLTKKFTTNDYEMLSVEEVDKILDLITNLQEENERLKDKVKLLEGTPKNKKLYINNELQYNLEEKKIPEKLPYYSLEKIQKAKNKDEWREERISLLEKRVNDLHIKMNDLLDYLKNKGE